MGQKKVRLAENLQTLISGNGCSLSKIAQENGLNKSTLHNYIYGVTPNSLNALVKLTEYFGISLDQLCLEPILEKNDKPVASKSIVLKVSIEVENDCLGKK